MSHPIVVAITGASGAVYAVRLLECLVRAGREVHLVISETGFTVIRQELKKEFRLESHIPADLAQRAAQLVRYFDVKDFMSPMASGSFQTGGMVICPCSGGTLHAIAHGASTNLIQRAAEVHLKERRKLVLVPRETPLSLNHIENLRQVFLAGAIVLPAAPGWYHGVRSVQDLVDFIVARILDQFGIEHDLMKRWGN